MGEIEKKSIKFRKSLRNANINYRNGWFFVTSQVAHNKSILGAIVGEECVLNSLGEKVRDYWLSLPAKYPELKLDEFVIMPNHFHAIVKIEYRPTNREHHLGFLMSRFKGGTGYIYGKMRREGIIEDIGEHLWQFDYWDNLITSESELEAIRKYIRDNPANWSRDRYGACTSYSFGNLALLNESAVAFVASAGGGKGGKGGLKPATPRGSAAPILLVGPKGGRCDNIVADGFSRRCRPIISTFTSAQERDMLRRALAKGRSVIQVVPQGIPRESDMSPALLSACREGRALLISPQPSGSRLNKKVATWCNEYVLRHADEIWVGDISPNGMLSSLLSRRL